MYQLYAAILIWPVLAVIFGICMGRLMRKDDFFEPYQSDNGIDPRIQWLRDNEARIRAQDNED